MNPASIPDGDAIAAADEAEREGSFHHASLGRRAMIVAAGPVANILVTLAIFAGFFMAIGHPVAKDAAEQLTIAAFPEGSAAQQAGIEIGDRIVAIEGERVEKLLDVQQAVMAYPDEVLDVRVDRDGRLLDFAVRTKSVEVKDRFGNPSRIGQIGIQAAAADTEFVKQGPVDAVVMAVTETGKMFEMMVTGIKQIVTGQRSIEELGGPVKIAKYSGEQLSLGWLSFVNFAALISLNLAFINLLPIPGLDGGHLAFYAAEAVRRKPVGARGMELAYRTGMALVLMLMLFVTFNDLVSLSSFG